MSIEQDIVDTIIARIVAECPEFGGRVEESAHVPLTPDDWPCVRVQLPTTQTETRDGGRQGHRPRKNDGQIAISLVHDGRDTTVLAAQRALGLRIDKALMDDPFLRGTDGKARVSELIFTGSQSGTTSNRGSVVSVRQLFYSATWRTTEQNNSVPMHA